MKPAQLLGLRGVCKRHEIPFERRGREDYAEDAKEKYKIWLFFLRPLRILCGLCVQKLTSFMIATTKEIKSTCPYCGVGCCVIALLAVSASVEPLVQSLPKFAG